VRITRILTLLLITCTMLAQGQVQQKQHARYASFYIETRLQPEQHITDSAPHTFSLNKVAFGAMLPLFDIQARPQYDSVLPARFGLLLHPSLSYTRLGISYFPQERILVNSQVTLGGYYCFGQKNALNINLRGMYNEDEFTISRAKLMYNFSGLYTRKVSRAFSYYLGGAYSYVFGEGLLLPLVGARVSWGRSSRLSMVLPLQVTYRTSLSERMKLQVYAHPQGGINRFRNRLNVPDSTQDVVMFRHRALALGAAFVWQVRNNVSLVVDPAVLLGQRIFITKENSMPQEAFADNTISRNLQLQLRLIWRPWQNAMRNRKNAAEEHVDDDNINRGF
jgi:hypothetical protein